MNLTPPPPQPKSFSYSPYSLAFTPTWNSDLFIHKKYFRTCALTCISFSLPWLHRPFSLRLLCLPQLGTGMEIVELKGRAFLIGRIPIETPRWIPIPLSMSFEASISSRIVPVQCFQVIVQVPVQGFQVQATLLPPSTTRLLTLRLPLLSFYWQAPALPLATLTLFHAPPTLN